MTIISFDLDGTLVTDEFSRTVWHQGIPELYAKQYACDFHRAQELIVREYGKVGDDALEWYDIHHWLRHFNLDGNWKALLGKFTPCIKTYPEVHEVLSHLNLHYQLIITSNAAREFLDLEIEKTNIAPYFNRVFSATSDFKEVKKNREFYLKLLNMLDANHTEVVHIGDHYRFDYLVPGELGIRSFYLDRSGKHAGPNMVKSLQEFISRLKSGSDRNRGFT